MMFMDKRHKNRIETVQNLFAYLFNKSQHNLPYPSDLTIKIIDHLKEIDAIIKVHAVKFPIDKIARIDLSILRLAIYELVITSVEPKKVIINEAIELAKEMGGEKSFSFINGVLGKLVQANET